MPLVTIVHCNIVTMTTCIDWTHDGDVCKMYKPMFRNLKINDPTAKIYYGKQREKKYPHRHITRTNRERNRK